MPEVKSLIPYAAYGVLLDAEELDPFYQKVGQKVSKQGIQRYMEHPHHYEKNDPLCGLTADGLVAVFKGYLHNKYPLLDIVSIPSLNVENEDFSGYLVFVSSTLQTFDGICEICLAEISAEEERQLNRFFRKFLAIKSDGWKVWSALAV